MKYKNLHCSYKLLHCIYIHIHSIDVPFTTLVILMNT